MGVCATVCVISQETEQTYEVWNGRSLKLSHIPHVGGCVNVHVKLAKAHPQLIKVWGTTKNSIALTDSGTSLCSKATPLIIHSICVKNECVCVWVDSPAATAEHITKNMPTAILFSEEGSRPLRFRMGSTTLSFKGISIRISTASNIVSQAAGKRKVLCEQWREKCIMYRTQRAENSWQAVGLCAGHL